MNNKVFPVVTWVVVRGKQMGRKLWFPTANIEHTSDLADWVYKMNIVYQDHIYPGMGTYFADRELLEAHLFDQDIDLYGQTLEIHILEKIRENKKFESLEALTTQIQEDQTKIQKTPRTVLTFGTFDYPHPGHYHYLSSSRALGDQLVTIIALDETVKRIKGDLPDHDQKQRLEWVQSLGLQDHVAQYWQLENVYSCLDEWKPQVICLWYDQDSFDKWIIEYCDQNKIPHPVVVRLSSHKPEQYKSSLIKNT